MSNETELKDVGVPPEQETPTINEPKPVEDVIIPNTPENVPEKVETKTDSDVKIEKKQGGIIGFLLAIWNSKPPKHAAPHLPLWKIFIIFFKLGLNAW